MMKSSALCVPVITIVVLLTSLTALASGPDKIQGPPLPGDMVIPMPAAVERATGLTTTNSYSAPAMSTEVVDLFMQIDESLMMNYLETLVSFGPRVTGSSAVDQAGDYIYDTFQDLGLDVRFQHWSYYGYSGKNVEATLYGTGNSDDIYVVCAHYDAVPGSPGADDNGSGTAAVMALAKVMSNYSFDKTIRFVTFDGEEQGLLGSHEYVEEAYNNGDNIVGALNADMIGFAISQYDQTHLNLYYDTPSFGMADYIDNVALTYESQLDLDVIMAGYTWGSDHNSFWDFNYDAVFYFEYNFNDYYHSPQDTIAHMNIPYMVKCTRLIAASAAGLAGPFETYPLRASKYTLSTRAADSIDFTLNAGSENGLRNYVLLVSSTGTEPGTILPGGHAVLPLKWDPLTDFVMAYLNTPLFTDFLGVLDADGLATAQLNTFGPLPELNGVTLYFAYCCNNPFDYVSNPLSVEAVD